MNPELELQAGRFETIAFELEAALTHARIAASHLRQGEVPRGCAHAFALEGHLLSGCATCHATLKGYQTVGSLLPFALTPAQPPNELKVLEHLHIGIQRGGFG